MFLPKSIARLVSDENYETDDIGMSGSSVLIYSDKVLKAQKYIEEARNEYRMLLYLHEKCLPVPAVYSYEETEDIAYLLMGKCDGQMACCDAYMSNPALQCKMLANGLKNLWSVDISDCPTDQRLPRKLAEAKYNVENGLVDVDNVQPDTFGEKGFRNPEELLQWLYDNQPNEELVLSHGDYCLPNVFGIKDKVTGYIDLGKTGIADKWCDIAICYRSLSSNYNGEYGGRGGKEYPDFDERLFFQELGLEPDWNKIRYYILLDELF